MNRKVALAIVLLAAALVPRSRANAVLPRVVADPTETFAVGMLRVEHFAAPGRQAVIFIPALFCGSWQWSREIAQLSGKYDLYAVTLPGFDGRPRDTAGNLMTRASTDLSALITKRRLGKTVIVGHSLGGTLAILFAEQHPAQVRAVVSAEGGMPAAPTLAERRKQVAQQIRPYVGIEQAELGEVLRKNMLQYVITDSSAVREVEARAALSDPMAIADWMRDALLLDLTPGLARITAPLTEIVPFDSVIDPYRGFKTEASKRAAYTSWLAHARRGSVVMIPHARHFVMIDQPAEFDRALAVAVEAR